MQKKSLIALLFCYATMLWFGFFYCPKWKNKEAEATISWDAAGYYTYLPAIFIYNDLPKSTFRDSLNNIYYSSPDQDHLAKLPNGNVCNKYPCGQAIAMLPFFAMANWYCKKYEPQKADGYSTPYQKAIGIGMFCFALLGLFLIRKLLLYYYSDLVSAITLLCIGIGSNYLNYASIDQAMTHSTLFTLYAAILLLIKKYYVKPNNFLAICIGLLAGWMVIIRPTEILVFILLIGWDCFTVADIKNRILFLLQHKIQIFLLAISFALVVSIQLVYWKTVSGNWIVYSYGTQGFNWLHPYFRPYLFSTKCGWLRYCPMMLVAMLGWFVLLFSNKKHISILLFLLLNFYVVCSWDIWWFGGRAMIQSYVAIAFCMAHLFSWVEKKNWLPALLSPLVFFAYLNIWWVYHSHNNKILVSDVTKQYWYATVGRWQTPNADVIQLLDNPDRYTQIILQADTLLTYKNYSVDSLVVNKDQQFSTTINFKPSAQQKKWLRVNVTAAAKVKENEVWKMTQLIVRCKNKNEILTTNFIRIHRNFKDSTSIPLFVDVQLPKKNIDSIAVSLWNADGNKECKVWNVSAISW